MFKNAQLYLFTCMLTYKHVSHVSPELNINTQLPFEVDGGCLIKSFTHFRRQQIILPNLFDK